MSSVKKIVELVLAYKIKRQYKTTKRYSQVWVFGEWFGKRCCDNCMYLANYVANQRNAPKLYWFTNPDTDVSRLDSRIHIVIRGTADSYKILKKCGVAIFSQGFSDFSDEGYDYTSGALTVHLWHGVPWKKIGHDASARTGLLYNIYKKIYDNVYGAMIYFSPSDKYDEICWTAFGAKEGQIVHAGYARNNDLYRTEKIIDAKMRVFQYLSELNLNLDLEHCKIITYMPTFRNYGSLFPMESLLKNTAFSNFIESENIVVIQKAHFVNQERGENNNYNNERIVYMNDVIAQDLLCASEMLITDYSGCFLDFLILNKPIIHFLYDYEVYRKQDKGLYYSKEDIVAGSEAFNEKQLVDAIIENYYHPKKYGKRREAIKQIYMKYESINSCEKIYKEIKNRLTVNINV